MAIVALVGSIHTAIADEASDAVQVLSKLWRGEDGKHSTEFIGDSKTFRIRDVYRSSDGTVSSVTTSEASFRHLEKDPYPRDFLGHRLDKPAVGVRCLFKRPCISRTGVIYDPVYRDRERRVSYPEVPHYYGFVTPSDGDNVRRALGTLILRLNAAPPFEPPAPR
jgi:hypothetical protein